MQFCTIVSRNYLPAARVLAESLQAHDEGSLTTLVVDDPAGAVRSEDEPFDVAHPEDLGIERRELHRMATIYDVTEMATSLKPRLLQRLLASGDEPVCYLDPDIEVRWRSGGRGRM